MATRIAPSADVSEAAVIGEGTAVWHLAQVRERAVLGQGCIVGRGAYIGEGVRMGRHCKVQNYALVYEPAVLADGVFIGPAVTLTNDRFPRAVNPDGSLKSASDWEPVGVTIEEGASIGAPASSSPGMFPRTRWSPGRPLCAWAGWVVRGGRWSPSGTTAGSSRKSGRLSKLGALGALGDGAVRSPAPCTKRSRQISRLRSGRCTPDAT